MYAQLDNGHLGTPGIVIYGDTGAFVADISGSDVAACNLDDAVWDEALRSAGYRRTSMWRARGYDLRASVEVETP